MILKVTSSKQYYCCWALAPKVFFYILSVLFNLLKLTVILSKLGEGGNQDSQVFTIFFSDHHLNTVHLSKNYDIQMFVIQIPTVL